MDTLDKIQHLLKDKGCLQQELTQYLGIDRSVYSAWKNGKNKSYLKYIPQIADFFGVSTDWLTGKARYKHEDLSNFYVWKITCVDGFDPAFDFAPLIKSIRESKGIAIDQFAEALDIPTDKYEDYETGYEPLSNNTADRMCEILGTTVKDVLMQTDKFSADGAPRSRTDGAFKVLFKNFTEGEYAVISHTEKANFKNNVLFFFKKDGYTLRTGADSLGLSQDFCEHLMDQYDSPLCLDIQKIADHYHIDFNLLAKHDLTRESGRNIAKMLKDKGVNKYQLSKKTGLPVELLPNMEKGYLPTAYEVGQIAEALEIDILDMPIKSDEYFCYNGITIDISEQERQLLREFRKLNEEGQDKVNLYISDIKDKYSK